MNQKELYTLGIDIGSTTVKIAICYNALNYKKMEEASGIIPGI